jgi:hypothetical protein
MNKKFATLVSLLVFLVVCIAISAALQSLTVKIPSTASITVVGLAVYSDVACTQNVTSIDWGTLAPGAVTNDQVYIKSTSTVTIALGLSTDSWNPSSASTYITLTWNYTAGTQIQPNASLPVTLTLTVSSSVTGITSFTFNIDITGSG